MRPKCISCGKSVHEPDEGPLDDMNSPFVAEDYYMEGPDVPQCFACNNDWGSYSRGRDKAHKQWTPMPPDTPCGKCDGIGLYSSKDENDDPEWVACQECHGSGTIAHFFENKTGPAEPRYV